MTPSPASQAPLPDGGTQQRAPARLRASSWLRLVVVEAVQLPALALVWFSPHPAAWWAAGLWGSVVCCAGTDSHWRWRNRALVLQAVVWLVAALVLGGSARTVAA